jgi:orotidine-5'-phosphate decarboxylase
LACVTKLRSCVRNKRITLTQPSNVIIPPPNEPGSPPASVSARSRLIVALDLDRREDSERLVATLGDAVTFYKVGWVTLLTCGLEFVRLLLDQNKQVFLDLKIYDVPNTVEEAIRKVAELGVRFATVHGNAENIEAAVRARGKSDLQILAVTVLTSLNEEDVRRLYSLPADVPLAQHATNVAARMVSIGCDGVVASPREITMLRSTLPPRTLIVTPGIRMEGETTDDHKRPGTPYEAIKAGADYLVVGRSIYRHADPRGQAQQYVEAIERGIEERS